MVLNFAHMGSLTEAPENTIPSIQKALEHKTKAIELDVQLTKDKQLVVVHDRTLERYNPNFTKNIREYTMEEIYQVDVGSAFSEAFKGTSFVTLEEILELLPEDIILNIEIKHAKVHQGIEAMLIDRLQNHNLEDQTIISAFDHNSLRKVQRIAPNIRVGLLYLHHLPQLWDHVKQSSLEVYSVHPSQDWTDQQIIEECHKLGCKVFPFTVNDLERYDQLRSYGVDGVFTDNPHIFSISSQNKL
ncbi:glycerophosphodiester phosphodiesterase [Gracilibacillus alcaliphilus]|uniref:glycerophosphodiester phosphodiesterase n=1 Tax=Gracilibacillus alcaliphilus TaxID=1401441 RepID=UPI00195DC02B|nr:glycerophosphodiester phosphodiesterase family protein [Gracilibacillus alcaliphilus]MBM7679015.1 glycerophosphoryl diester phosphodiesterase [Gracilibacillus alcaliphilus]